MLDLWHTFLYDLLTDTRWRDMLTKDLPGFPEGVTPERLLFAFVAVPLALCVLHALRVIYLLRFGRKCHLLRALNRTCRFDSGLKARYEYHVKLNSRKQLERYDFDRFFLEEFGRDTEHLQAIIGSAANNERLYRKYKTQVEELLGVTLEKGVRPRFFDPLEVKLCKRRLLQPVMTPVFHCTAEYTSPKGKNHYSRSAEYTLKQMEAIGKQYLKNVDFQQSKAYQRSLMTDSLRYDIMKRDGFRCVLCGRTAKEGVKLHVDHIIPVAKGGLTVPDNLRTLCDQCNLGKSDKYDPHGVN